jgi:hypothetical protein
MAGCPASAVELVEGSIPAGLTNPQVVTVQPLTLTSLRDARPTDLCKSLCNSRLQPRHTRGTFPRTSVSTTQVDIR